MPRVILKSLLFSPLIITLGFLGVVRADESSVALNYQQGRFNPANLAVPANKPFRVAVTNQDAVAIEFESFELHRERVVGPGETITVFIPALAPGNYDFFDDFHSAAPKGEIVAK